ncbi:hypothetical protein HYH03_009778 [Edaphochlamys debaryana]|uniref:EGF-like domain-containing protein n=1 Tax=Edaphochlamys debaryana TaxID=47281 RepID=A0A835XX52_9CHLO|nr:hypothetical protein HYH03_009778 [Edaphochlamys debaryana]|eukprot:KAG2491821.1 hypothetical protein HYH03_009778 [Edaphochlamys debaryana]
MAKSILEHCGLLRKRSYSRAATQDADEPGADKGARAQGRWTLLQNVVAVAALVGILAAALLLLGGGGGGGWGGAGSGPGPSVHTRQAPGRAFLQEQLPLRLVLTTPVEISKGEGDLLVQLYGRQALTAVFTRPVIALGSDFGTREPPAPFSLSCPVPVRQRWVTTTIFRLDPDVDWPTDLDCTLRWTPGFASYDGAPLLLDSTPASRRLSSPSLAMYGTGVLSYGAAERTDGAWDASSGLKDDILPEMPPDGQLVLGFSHPVNLQLLQEGLRLQASGGVWSSKGLGVVVSPCVSPRRDWSVASSAVMDRRRAAASSSPSASPSATPSPSLDLNTSCAQVAPAEELAANTRYTLRLPKGSRYHALAGPLGQAQEQPLGGLRRFRLPLQGFADMKDPRWGLRYRRLDLWLPHGLSEDTHLAALEAAIRVCDLSGSGSGSGSAAGRRRVLASDDGEAGDAASENPHRASILVAGENHAGQETDTDQTSHPTTTTTTAPTTTTTTTPATARSALGLPQWLGGACTPLPGGSRLTRVSRGRARLSVPGLAPGGRYRVEVAASEGVRDGYGQALEASSTEFYMNYVDYSLAPPMAEPIAVLEAGVDELAAWPYAAHPPSPRDRTDSGGLYSGRAAYYDKLAAWSPDLSSQEGVTALMALLHRSGEGVSVRDALGPPLLELALPPDMRGQGPSADRADEAAAGWRELRLPLTAAKGSEGANGSSGGGGATPGGASWAGQVRVVHACCRETDGRGRPASGQVQVLLSSSLHAHILASGPAIVAWVTDAAAQGQGQGQGKEAAGGGGGGGGGPVEGAAVFFYANTWMAPPLLLASCSTDERGLCNVTAAEAPPGAYLSAFVSAPPAPGSAPGAPRRLALVPQADWAQLGWAPQALGALVADRVVVVPGDSVKLTGFVQLVQGTALQLPAGGTAVLEVEPPWGPPPSGLEENTQGFGPEGAGGGAGGGFGGGGDFDTSMGGAAGSAAAGFAAGAFGGFPGNGGGGFQKPQRPSRTVVQLNASTGTVHADIAVPTDARHQPYTITLRIKPPGAASQPGKGGGASGRPGGGRPTSNHASRGTGGAATGFAGRAAVQPRSGSAAAVTAAGRRSVLAATAAQAEHHDITHASGGAGGGGEVGGGGAHPVVGAAAAAVLPHAVTSSADPDANASRAAGGADGAASSSAAAASSVAAGDGDEAAEAEGRRGRSLAGEAIAGAAATTTAAAAATVSTDGSGSEGSGATGVDPGMQGVDAGDVDPVMAKLVDQIQIQDPDPAQGVDQWLRVASVTVTVANPRPPTAELQLEVPTWAPPNGTVRIKATAVSYIGAAVDGSRITIRWSHARASDILELTTDLHGSATAVVDLGSLPEGNRTTPYDSMAVGAEWIGPTRERITQSASVLLADGPAKLDLQLSLSTHLPATPFAVAATLTSNTDKSPLAGLPVSVTLRPAPSSSTASPTSAPDAAADTGAVDPAAAECLAAVQKTQPNTVSCTIQSGSGFSSDCLLALPCVGRFLVEACADVPASKEDGAGTTPGVQKTGGGGGVSPKTGHDGATQRVCGRLQLGRNASEWAQRLWSAHDAPSLTADRPSYSLGDSPVLTLHSPWPRASLLLLVGGPRGLRSSVVQELPAGGLASLPLGPLTPDVCTGGCSVAALLSVPRTAPGDYPGGHPAAAPRGAESQARGTTVPYSALFDPLAPHSHVMYLSLDVQPNNELAVQIAVRATASGSKTASGSGSAVHDVAGGELVTVEPGGQAEITVSVAQPSSGGGPSPGGPAAGVEVTVYVVDKAFLDLMPYDLPQPQRDMVLRLAASIQASGMDSYRIAPGAVRAVYDKMMARLTGLDPWINVDTVVRPGSGPTYWDTSYYMPSSSSAVDMNDTQYLARFSTPVTIMPSYGYGGIVPPMAHAMMGGGGAMTLAMSSNSMATVNMAESVGTADVRAFSVKSAAAGRSAGVRAASDQAQPMAAALAMDASVATAARAGGGGAPAVAVLAPPRASAGFLVTPLFQAAATGPDGRAAFTFTAPPNLGTFVVRAFAADGPAAKYGSAQTKLAVKRQLSLTPSVPRFARVGDEFEAGVVVTVGSTPAEVTVTVKLVSPDPAAAPLALVGAASRKASFAAGGGLQQEVRFSFSAAAMGTTNLTFAAADAAAGGGSDALQLPLVVYGQQGEVWVATSFALAAAPKQGAGRVGWQEGMALPAAVRGSGGLTLTAAVGHLPAITALYDNLDTWEQDRTYAEAPPAMLWSLLPAVLRLYGQPPAEEARLKAVQRASRDLGALTDPSLGLMWSDPSRWGHWRPTRVDVQLNTWAALLVRTFAHELAPAGQGSAGAHTASSGTTATPGGAAAHDKSSGNGGVTEGAAAADEAPERAHRSGSSKGRTASSGSASSSSSTGVGPGLRGLRWDRAGPGRALLAGAEGLAAGWAAAAARQLVADATEARQGRWGVPPGPYMDYEIIAWVRLALGPEWDPRSQGASRQVANDLSQEALVAAYHRAARERGGGWSLQPRLLLALLLHASGSEAPLVGELAEGATSALRTQGRTAYVAAGRGSQAAAPLGAQALALLLLLRTGASHQLVPKLAAHVASPGSGSGFPFAGFSFTPSHVSQGLAMWALCEYDRTRGSAQPDVQLRADANGLTVLKASFVAGGSALPVANTTPWHLLPPPGGAGGAATKKPAAAGASATGALNFEVTGSGEVSVAAALRFVPSALLAFPSYRGLYVEAALQMAERSASGSGSGSGYDRPTGPRVSAVPLASIVVLTVQVTTPDDLGAVTLSVMMPAGLEPLDPNLLAKQPDPRGKMAYRYGNMMSYGGGTCAAGQLYDINWGGGWGRWWWPVCPAQETRPSVVTFSYAGLRAGTSSVSIRAVAATVGKFVLPPIRAWADDQPELMGMTAAGLVEVCGGCTAPTAAPAPPPPRACPSPTCSGSGVCDLARGVCVCARGFTGEDCSRLALGEGPQGADPK